MKQKMNIKQFHKENIFFLHKSHFNIFIPSSNIAQYFSYFGLFIFTVHLRLYRTRIEEKRERKLREI